MYVGFPTRLPKWWTRPVPNCQRTLLPQDKHQALADLRVTENDLRKWHSRGWISFDVDTVAQLDEPDMWEVQFVRNLALSGLADFQIAQLLEPLPKPYCFDPRYVVFHFEYGWVEPVEQDQFDVIEENVADWIEDIGARRSLRRLEEIKSLIEAQIESLTEPLDNADKE